LKYFKKKYFVFWPLSWQGVLAYLAIAYFSYGYLPADLLWGSPGKKLLIITVTVLASWLILNGLLHALENSALESKPQATAKPLETALVSPLKKAGPFAAYKKMFWFTVICLFPGLTPYFSQQYGSSLSSTVFDLGQLMGLFTFFALPCLSIYHLGHLVAYIRPKNEDQTKILFMSLLGVALSILGFMMTLAACQKRVGFP
jgi:hypothetical protein